MSKPLLPAAAPAIPLVRLALRLPKGPVVASSGELQVNLELTSVLDWGDGEISVSLTDSRKNLVYESLLSRLDIRMPALRPGSAQQFRLRIPLPLAAGHYRLQCGYHPTCVSPDRPSVYADCAVQVTAPDVQRLFHGLVDLAPAVELVETAQRAARKNAKRQAYAVPAAIDFGESPNPLLLNGFFRAEHSPTGGFRWTGERAMFLLRATGKKIKLNLLACRPGSTELPVKCSLFATRVQGRPDAELLLSDFTVREIMNISLVCPAELRGEVAAYKLIVHDTWKPSDHYSGSEDHRILGIALASVAAV